MVLRGPRHHASRHRRRAPGRRPACNASYEEMGSDGETDQQANRDRKTRHARRAAVRRRRRRSRRAGATRRRGYRRRAARGGPGPLSQLRAVGHHVAGAARRAGRPETGAAAHPLHDVATAAARRRQAPQVREGGRRRDGKLPPARRRGHLRHPRAHGAAVHAPRAARGRLGQLRIARRRRRRRHALHRVPAGRDQRRAAARDRRGDGRLPAELRRHAPGAGGAAGPRAEPARQRRHRHRGRDGDQHPAPQPGRGRHGARQSARRPGSQQRPAGPRRPRPGFPDRRAVGEHRRGADADLHHRKRHGARPGHVGGRRRRGGHRGPSTSPASPTE